MLVLAIAFLISAAAGFLTIRLFWGEGENCWSTLFLQGFLGFGTGFGLTSLLYFAWSVVFSPTRYLWLYLVLEVILLVGVYLVGWKRGKKINLPPLRFPKFPQHFSISTILLTIAFLAVLFFSLESFIEQTFLYPQGDWDGLAIWNLHARFMVLGESNWRDLFTPVLFWSHPDYPFLVPASIARLWSLSGTIRQAVPALVAGIFTFGSLGALFTALWSFRSSRQALLGTMVLAATPYFIILGAGQYADVPLGFFILSACVLIYTYEIRRRQPGFLILVGLFAGLGVWTKNDGWVFLLAVIVSRAGILLFRRQGKYMIREAGFLLAGMAPALLIGLYLKFFLAPPDDMLGYIVNAEGPLPTLRRLVDLSRYSFTLSSFGEYLYNLGYWKIPVLIVLAGYGWLIGRQKENLRTGSLESMALTLSLTFVGYFFVYILTPHSLQWHISTLVRLLMHIFPAFVFLFFMWVRDIGSPEKPILQVATGI